MKAAYLVGEIVSFKRDTTYGRDWELGEYERADSTPGWHYVRDQTGFRGRHYVPSRRLKKATGRIK